MTDQAVQEFNKLAFTHYGIVLSDAEAMEQAGHLLRFYKAVYGNSWTDTPNA